MGSFGAFNLETQDQPYRSTDREVFGFGLDVALEALREVRRKRLCTLEDLMHFARICRVASVMKPYLESLVAP